MKNPLPRPTDRPAPAGVDRDPWWDNTRFLSATLIVVLHTIGSIMSRHESLAVFHVATWAFRVPVFVVLAGVFSSAAPLGPRQTRNLLRSIALPALVFSLLFSLEQHALGGPFKLYVAQLPWTLWFLMSLFFWRLLLPLVVQLRHPLLVTTVVALAVGYVDEFGLTFSASRTLVYLPLFYFGWRLRQGLLRDWFEARWSLPVAVAGLLGSGVVGLLWHAQIKGTWLSMRHAYVADTPLGMEGAWLVRLLVLGAAAGLVVCLLRVMPKRRVPLISVLGSGGFTVYLLHPLVILPLREKGLIERADTRLELAALLVFAVTLAAALASPPVRRLVQPLTRPPVDRLLFTRPPAADPAVGPSAQPSSDTLSKRLEKRPASHHDDSDRELTYG
ncbi:acyltransferase family protein [Streptomyces sp. ISL-12]|uniref:acyltransferase family protein n=1 Tax=Streptomyces sp. ISL-12 TaxID=2819177 RepID=UPI001BE76424|nr:acyltransferase family protein [Streptomyces sp. ISL-12]MBT2413909.1 acyltransferase family protein [Streptomyces sp. ISL-12]